MTRMKQEKEKVIAVVLNDGRPFSVTTTRDIYDVEYCKGDDTLYFNSSGSGGDHNGEVFLEGGRESDYWLAKRFRPKFNPGAGEGNRLKTINPKWLRLPEFWGVESDAVYCTVCDDWLPTNDVVEDVCGHIHWDDELGWWAGEGYAG